MFLRNLILLSLLMSGLVYAQGELQVDFLGSYYDQDGDRSPVTGGVGTEDLQSTSPVFVITYNAPKDWTLVANLGVDNISSASTDNMDAGLEHMSSASRMDNRAFTTLSATKIWGANSFGGTLGFSKEYDYRSINGGLHWFHDFNQKNTSFGLVVHYYADDIELYDIDGILRGEDTRSTTDFSASLTQVMSPKLVGSLEFSMSDQSGFLSSPFQEVVLTDGERVAERLPDNRTRYALRLSANWALSSRTVLRSYLRHYDDDFEIQSQTLELEPHFRLALDKESWIYPILRYHTQDGSPYFGAPGTFDATEPFYTADHDLSSFDSYKVGLGYKIIRPNAPINRFDIRLTYYEKDTDFSSFAVSFGVGWGVR